MSKLNGGKGFNINQCNYTADLPVSRRKGTLHMLRNTFHHHQDCQGIRFREALSFSSDTRYLTKRVLTLKKLVLGKSCQSRIRAYCSQIKLLYCSPSENGWWPPLPSDFLVVFVQVQHAWPSSPLHTGTCSGNRGANPVESCWLRWRCCCAGVAVNGPTQAVAHAFLGRLQVAVLLERKQRGGCGCVFWLFLDTCPGNQNPDLPRLYRVTHRCLFRCGARNACVSSAGVKKISHINIWKVWGKLQAVTLIHGTNPICKNSVNHHMNPDEAERWNYECYVQINTQNYPGQFMSPQTLTSILVSSFPLHSSALDANLWWDVCFPHCHHQIYGSLIGASWFFTSAV